MSSAHHSRLMLPPAIVGVGVLSISLFLHFQAYLGLTLLSFLQDVEEQQTPVAAMEFEILEPLPADPDVAEATDDDAVDPQAADVGERLAAATPEPEPTQPRPEAEPPEPETLRITPPAPANAPPVSQPSPERRTSVEHRSADPSVAPPEDAQHLAEENSRVEEETMARIRNPNLNDPEPQAAEQQAPSEETQEGDAPDAEMAHLQDADGSDERDPTPEEARQPPPPDTRRVTRSETPSVSEAARGDRRTAGNGDPRPASAAPGGGRQAQGGGVPMREIMVSDGQGSFRVSVPDHRAMGQDAGDGGGARIAGAGQGSRGEGRRSGRAGSGRRAGAGATSRGRGAPDLRISWSQFSTVYGEEQLEREREAYLEQRRSRSRGVSRAERWRRFRAAIENYDVRVQPGNQTALNTRADPFAAYIAAMHRRIHPRFAGGYLTRVPDVVETTYRSNQNMNTKLELAIDAEGRVGHVSVVATSGDMLFDLGAYESVLSAQPFPAPPPQVRSPDGLTYLHWSFYRNHRQCGTFNAQPYILAQAPEPRDERDGPPGELIDRGALFEEEGAEAVE